MTRGQLLFSSASMISFSRTVTVHPAKCVRRTPQACAAGTARPSEEKIESLFSQLKHVNKNLQKKAGSEIAEFATEKEVDRLLKLLEVEDVHHRRAAVQALGMTGLQAVPKLIQLLSGNPNSTIRASCAKALAAVALFYPENREAFPLDALDGLQRALKEDDDPVTRLSVVGCLSTLGSDFVQRGSPNYPGCSKAVDVLFNVCRSSSDMAVGATAVGALAQVAQNGSIDTKNRVLQLLRSMSEIPDSDDSDSALGYVKEIAATHAQELSLRMAKAAE